MFSLFLMKSNSLIQVRVRTPKNYSFKFKLEFGKNTEYFEIEPSIKRIFLCFSFKCAIAFCCTLPGRAKPNAKMLTKSKPKMIFIILSNPKKQLLCYDFFMLLYN